jgi:hypothetical protein
MVRGVLDRHQRVSIAGSTVISTVPRGDVVVVTLALGQV